ncbi:type I restriction system adenine methylase HsdM [Lachnospiraceae bacterium PFB1-21]
MTETVLSNPPYSMPWEPVEDERFTGYPLAPKSKADYAFLLHAYHNLGDNGTMGILLPHGVLFRGQKEEEIRRKLLDDGAIEIIVGLPEKLFKSTSIPVALLILRKNRSDKSVYFVDASREYVKEKAQNVLTEKEIEKITSACKAKVEIEKYAHLASLEEIKKNDYNLNIPRYVDTFEPEELKPMSEIVKEMRETDAKIKETEAEFCEMLGQLVGNTPEAARELKELVDYFNVKTGARQKTKKPKEVVQEWEQLTLL